MGLSAARVTAVVPTLGKSPALAECLGALRASGGDELRILLVAQGVGVPALVAEPGVERIDVPEAIGFARAVNLGIDAAQTEYVAIVNDDAFVEPAWIDRLVAALDRDSRAAAAQGVNLLAGEPARIDGCGIEWNERSQAIQIGHGRPASEVAREDGEPFGVSATAAIYRRDALDGVALGGEAFDARLGSYYEDVDLACRLRAAGHTALLVAAARCRHLGSSSSTDSARLRLVYRNRYAVLKRHLGPQFGRRLPGLVLRDAIDAASAFARGRVTQAFAIVRGVAAAPALVAHTTPADVEAAVRRRGARAERSLPCSRLEGLVVHWRSPDAIDRLIDAWPADPRFGLIVVDNSGELGSLSHPRVRVVHSGVNLGFAGGINRGLATATADHVMLLNPDARPFPGAVEELARSLDEHPEWAGVIPRLVGDDGAPQWEWQLRPLPRPGGLLRQVFFLRGVPRARVEPPARTAIEQPAGAALALRRSVLAGIGGLDATFHPAWFEDVDLAARLAHAGETMAYWPAATFAHGMAGSLEALGYGAFLWIYYRNLVRYLRKHHGAAWAAAALVCLPAAALARALLLPLRRPRRARGRGDALRGLGNLALGAVTGFRAPARLKRAFASPVE